MNFFKWGNIFLICSGALVALSFAAILGFGLNLGIDFVGGAILEVEYEHSRPSNEEMRSLLKDTGLVALQVQPIGNQGVILRMEDISEEKHQEILAKLGENAKELRFEAIGPVIGKELRDKALRIAILSTLAIAVYIWVAFRRITRPVKSWQWSLVALLVSVHDIVIPLGLLALLGRYGFAQISIPVVVALLTVIGYSINDTVVVFDRIRENLEKQRDPVFGNIVNISIKETLMRSINTGFSTILVLAAILISGGETLRYFSVTLMVGIAAGTWSSLFVAPFLLVKLVERGKDS